MLQFIKEHVVATIVTVSAAAVSIGGLLLDLYEFTQLGMPNQIWSAIGLLMFIGVVVVLLHGFDQKISKFDQKISGLTSAQSIDMARDQLRPHGAVVERVFANQLRPTEKNGCKPVSIFDNEETGASYWFLEFDEGVVERAQWNRRVNAGSNLRFRVCWSHPSLDGCSKPCGVVVSMSNYGETREKIELARIGDRGGDSNVLRWSGWSVSQRLPDYCSDLFEIAREVTDPGDTLSASIRISAVEMEVVE